MNAGGAIRCEVVDEQVGRLIESLVLPDDWLDAVLERISLRDEVARVHAEREQACRSYGPRQTSPSAGVCC